MFHLLPIVKMLFSGPYEDEKITYKEDRVNLSINMDYHEYIATLGEQFIELLDKMYHSNIEKEKTQLKKEMQCMFNYIKRLGHTNRHELMLDGNIRDYFFTAGDCPEDIIEGDEKELYEYDKFCTYLLCYESVSKALKLVEKLDKSNEEDYEED